MITRSFLTNPIATHGMVTSPHYLASEAGLFVLRRGGNALEASIAVATTLAVVYPHMCTLGGDAFWLVYTAKNSALHGINASGRAAEKATIETYKNMGYSAIPIKGYAAANTVPGLVSGLQAAYELSVQECDGKESFAALLESAEAYAEDGFPQSVSFARHVRMLHERRAKQGAKVSQGEFDRVILAAEEERAVFRQPDLAKTLRLLARHGTRDFYEGSIARAITDDIAAHGGLLSPKDFVAHKADFVTPLTVPYRGTIACNLPPNSQGMASLELLNILNALNLSPPVDYAAQASLIDLIVAATKEAFADRDTYLTDPTFADIPLTRLLSAEYGKMQAERILAGQRKTVQRLLDPAGDTVWFGVMDGQGNAVSCIQSIYYDFGAEVVPVGTGILLQNRGSYFSLDPSHVNCLAPGKRTFHTLNPALLLENGKPRLIYGTMGGEGQPQTQACLVTRIIDFGQSPAEAIFGPRWLYGSAFGERTNSLKLEQRFGSRVCELLRQKGYTIQVVDAFHEMMGHAGAILVDQQTGTMQGASDPRSDGLAVGF